MKPKILFKANDYSIEIIQTSVLEIDIINYAEKNVNTLSNSYLTMDDGSILSVIEYFIKQVKTK